MEKNKFKKIGKGVYISLAICMLIIAAIGIFSSVKSVSNLVDENIKDLGDISVGNEIITGLFPQEVNEETEASKTEDNTEKLPDEKPEKKTVWIEPVEGDIIKRYSNGELCYSQTMNDYRTHNGIDVTGKVGDPVLAVGAGVITDITNDPLWGMTVSVDHGDGIKTIYKNLSETLPTGIEVGAYVSDGGVVGAVSTSALVEIGELPHVHLEVYSNGALVDPIETLKIYE